MSRSEAARARWADPVWRAQTVQKIRAARQGHVAKLPLADFLALLVSSSSLADVAKKLDASWEAVRYRIQTENIQLPSHIRLGPQPNLGRKFPGRKHYSDEEVFVQDSKHPTIATRRFEETTPDACEGCGIGPIWNGKPLHLQVDHKNGNSRDCRKENLQKLCPNCHTQTPTYAGRNGGSHRKKYTTA